MYSAKYLEGSNITVYLFNSQPPLVMAAQSSEGNLTLEVEYEDDVFLYNGTEYTDLLLLIQCPFGYMDEFGKTEWVFFYYYNPTTNKFELIGTSRVVDGFVTFQMTHCSDYIVSTEQLPSSVVTSSADTGEVNYGLVVWLGMILPAGCLFFIKRKDECK